MQENRREYSWRLSSPEKDKFVLISAHKKRAKIPQIKKKEATLPWKINFQGVIGHKHPEFFPVLSIHPPLKNGNQQRKIENAKSSIFLLNWGWFSGPRLQIRIETAKHLIKLKRKDQVFSCSKIDLRLWDVAETCFRSPQCALVG